ncbi:MAG: porin [Gemmatimonadales bacterium]
MRPCSYPGLVLAHLIMAGSVGAQSPPASPAVKLSGYLQAREVYQRDVGLTSSINRARLAASGSVLEAVTWRIQGEFRTGSVGTGKASVSLQDAYLRYAPKLWALQIGQFKTPFALEFITSLADVETADRSTVVDSLAPKRDIGLMAEYTPARVHLWAGVFNGEGQNVTGNPDSSLLGAGRVAVRVLPELSLAINGARYFGDSTRYGGDVAYEHGAVILKGEYIGQARDGISAPDDWGWYGLGATYLTPSVQAVGKYEDFGRPSISTGSRNRAWTAGVNVYPGGKNLRLTFDYVSRKIGVPGTRKGRVLAQVQARF